MFLDIMFSNFLQPYIIYPTGIVDNAKPTFVDNIFTNYIENDISSGNLIENVSDNIPNYQKSELRKNSIKKEITQISVKRNT